MTYTVYLAWDESGNPLYVGHTSNVARRLTEHTRASWWPAVARLSSWSFTAKSEALSSERYAIRYLTPHHNRLSNPAATA